jgi:hypothetical protein
MPASGAPASTQHEAAATPQLSMQLALHPCGTQHVLLARHSAPAGHPHCTVCPQLFTCVTPQAPAQGSVGVQHELW